jgi:hypothetical protein
MLSFVFSFVRLLRCSQGIRRAHELDPARNDQIHAYQNVWMIVTKIRIGSDTDVVV